MPKRIKIGEKVTWSVGRGKEKLTMIGTVVELNPKVAPGSKFGVKVDNPIGRGKWILYPRGRVKRLKKVM